MRRAKPKTLLAVAVSAASLVAGLFAYENARASAIPLAAGSFQGATIGASNQVVIGSGSILGTPVTSISQFLYLENVGSTTLCIKFGGTATISSGVCAAGEIALQPGGFRFFDVALPTDSVNAIGSAAGGLLTVGAQ